MVRYSLWNNFVLSVSLFWAVAFVVTAQASAQQDGKQIKKIGVVDMRRILDESQAARHIQDQVESKRQKLKEEFGNLENQLKQQKQKLVKEQGQLSQKAFQQKRAQFQQKLEQTRNKAKAKRQKLKQAINKAMDVLRKNVKQVVVKLGKSNNYDLVISRQGAIYAADKHDMTDTVLSRLDDKITEIDLQYSAE